MERKDKKQTKWSNSKMQKFYLSFYVDKIKINKIHLIYFARTISCFHH